MSKINCTAFQKDSANCRVEMDRQEGDKTGSHTTAGISNLGNTMTGTTAVLL